MPSKKKKTIPYKTKSIISSSFLVILCRAFLLSFISLFTGRWFFFDLPLSCAEDGPYSGLFIFACRGLGRFFFLCSPGAAANNARPFPTKKIGKKRKKSGLYCREERRKISGGFFDAKWLAKVGRLDGKRKGKSMQEEKGRKKRKNGGLQKLMMVNES